MARGDLDLADIQGLFRQHLTSAVSKPTIFNYVPHQKQIQFHSSIKNGRLYIGGNRSGKTVGGIAEDVFRARGVHPYQRIPPAPTRGRIVTVSFKEGIQEIILPELSKWVPPSDLINGSWEDSYAKADRKLSLANGSFIELMSYDQALEKFAGTSRHFVHFDEEPPEDIFNECKMRLLDTGGPWFMTMTPVEGMTWVYDKLYEPGISGDPMIDVIVIDTSENPYVTEEQIEIALSGLSEQEKDARKRGKFVQLGGLAFPHFQPHHVIDPYLPDTRLTTYQSMDHGLNAPTAWLWHAILPNGTLITFDELYDTNRLVAEYAEEIHKRNKMQNRRYPDLYVGDPAIRQRNAQTGDSIQTAYARLGIPIVLGNNEVRVSVDKMNTYLMNRKWFITSNCHNLIREMQKCRWKIYENAKKRRDNNPREELHPRFDHSPDSVRYLMGLLPDLEIKGSDPKARRVEEVNQAVQQMVGAGTLTVSEYRYDRRPPTKWSSDANTQWLDEHMGGEW